MPVPAVVANRTLSFRVRVALHVARFRGWPGMPQTMHHPSAHKHTHGTIQHQPALWRDRPLPPVAESHGLQGPYRASLFVLLPPLYGFESVKPSGTHTGLCFFFLPFPTGPVFCSSGIAPSLSFWRSGTSSHLSCTLFPYCLWHLIYGYPQWSESCRGTRRL